MRVTFWPEGPVVAVDPQCGAVEILDYAVVEDGVFLGPGVLVTNDRVPRAVNPDGSDLQLLYGANSHQTGTANPPPMPTPRFTTGCPTTAFR